MNCNLLTYQTILFLFVFSGVFSLQADDMPKLYKKGGVSYENLWKEEDVKNYLDLPCLVSIDDVLKRLEVAQRIGGYQIYKDNNHPFKANKNELGSISFNLSREDLSAFHVIIYDYKSWNTVCDDLFRHITDTVALWNRIPDYYTIKKSNDIYTITHNDENPKKWHFDLKKLFVITVDAEFKHQKSAKSKEDKIAQIDQVIHSLVTFIEGNGKEAKQPAE